MKAPEKIYIDTNDNLSASILYGFIEKRKDDDIEYIRKDAFIENACSGIEKLLSGYIIRNFNFGDSYDIDKLIEDFKKHMKGE